MATNDERLVDLIVSWRKACDCKSTSSTGHVSLETERGDESYKIKATFHPGPVCDECATPWEPANSLITSGVENENQSAE